MERPTVTRRELAETLYREMGLPKRDAARMGSAFFDTIKEGLLAGEQVKIVNFGSFTIRHKEPRRGRNPQTGEPMEISRRRMVSFKACKDLRQRLNNGS